MNLLKGREDLLQIHLTGYHYAFMYLQFVLCHCTRAPMKNRMTASVKELGEWGQLQCFLGGQQ